MSKAALVWLRHDLRLADNPALYHAARSAPVIPVYLYTPAEDGHWAAGAASRWWLHHSLERLADALAARGSRLIIRQGADSLTLLLALIEESGADTVHWNRRYEPAGLAVDRRVKAALRERGITALSHPGNLLYEPWQVQRRDGGHYRVFTAFWRAAAQRPTPAAPLPEAALPPPEHWPPGLPVTALGLLPRIRWDGGLAAHWQPGEAGARARLDAFIDRGLADYAERREMPAEPGTSRLSPHVHFGEVSARQIHAAVVQQGGAGHAAFLTELGWREFAHHLLYHEPQMPERPLDERFATFPWRPRAEAALAAWHKGRTGIPIVDAGMRELWHSGWMHNRVRMIVGSLLTKNLRIPWQRGERWFWDTLVDADLANNSMGWQWIQGCGADAAPYFRIFNPVRQAQRFDPDGRYVRRWVPELARLPLPYLHAPWEAPAAVLEAAAVRLGRDYPRPIVDLQQSRREALQAYQQLQDGRVPPSKR